MITYIYYINHTYYTSIFLFINFALLLYLSSTMMLLLFYLHIGMARKKTLINLASKRNNWRSIVKMKPQLWNFCDPCSSPTQVLQWPNSKSWFETNHMLADLLFPLAKAAILFSCASLINYNIFS